uniref:MPN domain-containing protein n=1 Tax=Noctiluca scintillans TaxID=2966 RepID=A0A7S1A9U7_NOCSC
MPAAAGVLPKTYAFEPKAYAKAVMHCCKHSSEGVTGVFVGQVNQKVLRIVDAVPLFHTHALAPLLKVAFMLIEQYCQGSTGLEIVGLYYASSHGPSVEITPIKGIAEKLVSNFSAASIWTLDPAKLPEGRFALQGKAYPKDEWKPISSDSITLSEEALKHTGRIISELKYLEIEDFDDHLADAKKNWLNPRLFEGDPLGSMTSHLES